MDLKQRLIALRDQCKTLNELWKPEESYFGVIEFALDEMIHWCDCLHTFTSPEQYDDFVEELETLNFIASSVDLEGCNEKVIELVAKIKNQLNQLLQDIYWEQIELHYGKK